MIDALLNAGNIAFSGALAMMLLIAAVEGVGALIGASVSEHLQSLLPDTDVDANAEIDVSEAALGPFTKALGWLRVGQDSRADAAGRLPDDLRPGRHRAAESRQGCIFGSYLPSWIAVPAVSVGSLLLLRAVGGVLSRVIPMEETDAVTEDSFVGLVATITLGTARQGEPAQAKLRDPHGHTHYVMVEPDDPQDAFAASEEVLIIRRMNDRFAVVGYESEVLKGATPRNLKEKNYDRYPDTRRHRRRGDIGSRPDHGPLVPARLKGTFLRAHRHGRAEGHHQRGCPGAADSARDHSREHEHAAAGGAARQRTGADHSRPHADRCHRRVLRACKTDRRLHRQRRADPRPQDHQAG